MLDPIRFDKGVMPISTPIKKTANPKIINIDPIPNLSKSGVSSGVRVKFNNITIMIIGITESKTSFNFSVNTFKYLTSFR